MNEIHIGTLLRERYQTHFWGLVHKINVPKTIGTTCSYFNNLASRPVGQSMQLNLKLKIKNAINEGSSVDVDNKAIFVGGRRRNRKKRRHKNGQNRRKLKAGGKSPADTPEPRRRTQNGFGYSSVSGDQKRETGSAQQKYRTNKNDFESDSSRDSGADVDDGEDDNIDSVEVNSDFELDGYAPSTPDSGTFCNGYLEFEGLEDNFDEDDDDEGVDECDLSEDDDALDEEPDSFLQGDVSLADELEGCQQLSSDGYNTGQEDCIKDVVELLEDNEDGEGDEDEIHIADNNVNVLTEGYDDMTEIELNHEEDLQLSADGPPVDPDLVDDAPKVLVDTSLEKIPVDLIQDEDEVILFELGAKYTKRSRERRLLGIQPGPDGIKFNSASETATSAGSVTSSIGLCSEKSPLRSPAKHEDELVCCTIL